MGLSDSRAVRGARRRTVLSEWGWTWVGVLLMFVFTWPIYTRVGLFTGYGVALAGLLTTWLAKGAVAVRSVLRRFLIWRVGVRWYLIVLLLPLALNLIGIGIYRVWSGEPFSDAQIPARQIFGNTNRLWAFVVPFFVIDLVTNGEELGWRGFLLPRLQRRWNALESSVVLGLIWGAWHFPHVLSGQSTAEVGMTVLHSVPAAIIYTWVFNNTRGSLLVMSLFHAAYNTWFVFLPGKGVGGSMGLPVTLVGVEFAAALVIVILYGGRSLTGRGGDFETESE